MGITYKKLNVSAIKRICKKTSILWNAEYKITFNLQNSIGSWTYSSCSAYYGDIIVISTANSDRTRTITCYKWDSPTEPRWSNTITWPANNAQYTYTNFKVDLIGRITVENAMTITASCTRTLNSYTITWKYLSAYPDTWTTGIQTYNYGDTPSRTSPSTVTSGNERKAFTSWDNLATVTGNRTITAQYQLQGKFAVALENCIQTDGDTINGWYPYGTNCSITAIANSQWAFDSNGTSTFSYSDNVPASFKISPNYCNITVKGSYCTITVDGITQASNWLGLVPNGANIVYTASTNYAFDSSGTTTKTVTVNGPGTYDNSPTYGYYALSLTNCQYFSGTAAGWHPLGTKPSTTVQANNDWSFGGTTANDRATLQGNVVVPMAWKPSPKYCNITVSGSDCTIKVGNTNRDSGWTGIVALETTITWTAKPNYAFDYSGRATDTQPVKNPGSYRREATHGYYNLDLTHCSYASGDKAGWYALHYSHKPSTTVKADDGWAFTRGGQETITIESTVVIPTTGRASPTYFYLTFVPKNCKSSLNSGYYESSTKPSKVTWTPDPYYSFEAGATQKSSETSINATEPTKYEATPQYVRADSISVGIGNASVNRDANTYYATDTVVTWTAIANHYYDASGTTTSTNNNTKITAGATISAPNPTHVKCTISSDTSCQADKTTGSILPVGETITWTRTSGDNYKYSFSDKNEDSTTATAKVELGLTSYKKEAPYLWYNVTSVTGTNCTAYANSNCTTQFTPGWKLSNDHIYWKASAAYAFDTSNTDSQENIVVPGENTANASYVKRYTLSLTKNANVFSIKAWRTDSPYQGATIGSSSSPLLNGTGSEIIYYGDSLAMEASANQYYHLSESGSKTVTVTDNVSWAPTAIANNYPVKIAAGEGISDVYLSSDPNATSGSPSGTEFPFGSTVYAFAQLSHSLVPAIIVPSNWVRVDSSGSWIYRVDSKQLNPSWNLNFGTINAELRSYAVTIKPSEGINSVFLSTNHDALSGSPSGTEFKATTTVYAFAAVDFRYVHRVDESKWTKIGTSGSSTVYMVGRTYIETSPYDFGTITLPAAQSKLS